MTGYYNKSNFYRTGMVILVSMLIVAALSVYSVYYALTEVKTSVSPTGEYKIVMNWTNMGQWGWRGKVYLAENKLGAKKYETGWSVPVQAEWLSDSEFILRNNGETESFAADKIIK